MLLSYCFYLSLRRFNPVWCPDPRNLWSNGLRFCDPPCRFPNTTLHYGILLHQYLQGSKATQYSPFQNVAFEYREQDLVDFSKPNYADHFHFAYRFHYLLDTFLFLHDVHVNQPHKEPGCIRAGPGPSFVLVCFSKQQHQPLRVRHQESSHQKRPVFNVLSKISRWPATQFRGKSTWVRP